MSASPPTALTPDQQHIFRTAVAWRDFRALFQQYETALAAHVLAASSMPSDGPPSHELQWRHIYHDRESNLRQLVGLVLLPIGVVSTHHKELRFTTVHTFAPADARRLFWGRALASLAYHAAFVAAILCGVGAVVALTMLALADSGMKEMSLLFFAVVGFVAAMLGAAKSRFVGLPARLRPIAKDAFDLVAIRRISRP